MVVAKVLGNTMWHLGTKVAGSRRLTQCVESRCLPGRDPKPALVGESHHTLKLGAQGGWKLREAT